MIYNVFGGTLNLAQSNPNSSRQSLYSTKNFFSAAVLGFSERKLMFMFAICRRPSVCLSSLVSNVRKPYSDD